MERGVAWSEEDVEKLRIGLAAGSSNADLCRKYPEWPPSSVQQMCKKLRLGQEYNRYVGSVGARKITEECSAEISAMAEAEVSYSLADMQSAILEKH